LIARNDIRMFAISSKALFISFSALRFGVIVGDGLDNIDIMSEAAYYRKSFIFIVGKGILYRKNLTVSLSTTTFVLSM